MTRRRVIDWSGRSLGAVQELHDIGVSESAVTALAHAEERKLAAITEPLDGIHMQVEHLSDLRGREEPSHLVHHLRGQRRFLQRSVSLRSSHRCGARDSWSDSKVEVPARDPVRSVQRRPYDQ
jgi:hypothetical protein